MYVELVWSGNRICLSKEQGSEAVSLAEAKLRKAERRMDERVCDCLDFFWFVFCIKAKNELSLR
jgi:hypothetical protein